MSGSDIILSVENVSKEYQLGTFSAGTFGGDVQRWWYKMRGKEDPFTKIGANDRSKKTDDDFVLALQDINFEVKKGEVLGIIGKNGAGKSTLLKLLSRVTTPTTGSIKVGGRMASLLEVGTGFHPELTGMENIFLNGAILGMTKAEIKVKLDEIIDFSGCAQYIDTPVKRYSSGMRVRLGFAVAAFLDPEILVVDEVLAVGDAEFQKKAIGKMQDISKGGGRTVLFVSHNMASVASLCTRGLVMKNGMVNFTGGIDESISHYLRDSGRKTISNVWETKPEHKIESSAFTVNEIKIYPKGKNSLYPINMSDIIEVKTTLRNKNPEKNLNVTLQFKDDQGNFIFVTSSNSLKVQRATNLYSMTCIIPSEFFNEGEFSINLLLTDGKKRLHLEEDVISFTVTPKGAGLGEWMGKTKGPLKPKFTWTVDN